MSLWEILRRAQDGARTRDKIRLWCVVVLFSPIILAVYLGMWAEGWLDRRLDRD